MRETLVRFGLLYDRYLPEVIAELVLLGTTLRHILTHKTYKRGNRTLWLIVAIVGMEFIGPILYFLLGKEDA